MPTISLKFLKNYKKNAINKIKLKTTLAIQHSLQKGTEFSFVALLKNVK